MAPTKKNATVNKEETKSTAKKTTSKAEEVKAEAPEVKAEEPKAAEKKKPGRKPAAKPVEKKEAEEKAVETKEAEVKPAETKEAAGKEITSQITLQFDGKSYTQEELVQIAKDVWQYDLNQDEAALSSVELYVKPEEHVAYYVINRGLEEFRGSFYL